jgi:hypothetical protein
VVQVVIPGAVADVGADRAQGEVVQFPDGLVVGVPVAADDELGLARCLVARVSGFDAGDARART